MQRAPIPQNESARLESLRKLGLLDTPPEERFDRITTLATKYFHVPISTISLVDANREWFKSVCGLNVTEGDRAISFCGHAMLAPDIFVIPDTKKDPRFSDNPMVVGEPYIGFYAGVPLIAADGARIGTFCIKDHTARQFSLDDQDALKQFAKWAELELNAHNLSLALDQVRNDAFQMEVFFDQSAEILGIASQDGYYKKVNKTFVKIFGFSAEELARTPFLSLIHPEDQEKTALEVSRLGQGLRTEGFLARMRTVHGEYRTVNWNAVPNGQLIYVSGRDVTDEEILREKERFFRGIVEQGSQVVIYKDLEGKVLIWNQAAERLYGFTAEEIVGKSVHFIVPEERDDFEELMSRVKQGEEIIDYETIRKTKSGKRIEVSLSLSPIRNAQGQIYAICILAHDETRRKQREHELEQLTRAMVNRELKMIELKKQIKKLGGAA